MSAWQFIGNAILESFLHHTYTLQIISDFASCHKTELVQVLASRPKVDGPTLGLSLQRPQNING